MTGANERIVAVGPVLNAEEPSRAVIAAMRGLNPAMMVQDRGAYWRVLVPFRCVVTREAIEHELGRRFTLPGDLERLMPSFTGRLTITDDRAVWDSDS